MSKNTGIWDAGEGRLSFAATKREAALLAHDSGRHAPGDFSMSKYKHLREVKARDWFWTCVQGCLYFWVVIPDEKYVQWHGYIADFSSAPSRPFKFTHKAWALTEPPWCDVWRVRKGTDLLNAMRAEAEAAETVRVETSTDPFLGGCPLEVVSTMKTANWDLDNDSVLPA